jgi:hypothetical protein
MDIKQAEEQFAKFTHDVTEGHLNVADFMDFCDNFIELMKKKKLSQDRINLLTSVLALFLWSDDYLQDYNNMEFLIGKYLELMNNQ